MISTDPRTTPPLRLLETLSLAAGFGLLAGIGEALVLAFRKFVLNDSVLRNLDMLWTGPVASLVLVLSLGILLFLLSRLMPKVITWQILVSVFAGIGFLPALLAMEQLHRVAACLLAIGFGVQTARYVGAQTLEMNLEPSQGSYLFDESRTGPAGVLVPAWVEDMLNDRR